MNSGKKAWMGIKWSSSRFLDSRICRRYTICSFAWHCSHPHHDHHVTCSAGSKMRCMHCHNDIHSLSVGCFAKTMEITYYWQFHWITHSVWICIVSFWMARAWKGHSHCPYSFQASNKFMYPHSFKLTLESSLMAVKSKLHLRAFIILSVAGVYSLFPLLFHVAGKHKHIVRRKGKRRY